MHLPHVVNARALYAHTARTMTNASWSEIGRAGGRIGHTTYLYSARLIGCVNPILIERVRERLLFHYRVVKG
jgi:hypothetical protein